MSRVPHCRSQEEEWNNTNRYLIAACLADDSDSAMQIFTDWFEHGKALRNDFFTDWELDIEHPDVEAEFRKHESWRKQTEIRATPTVLVNGYRLPESYKIEDLEFNVHIK